MKRQRRFIKPLSQTTADPDVIAAWSGNLSDAFIQCRDMGHTWRPYTARYDDEMNAYTRVLRCGRCHTRRVQSISLNGAILTGGYVYPDGYQAPPGQGRIDGDGRGALRLESTLRLVNKLSQKVRSA